MCGNFGILINGDIEDVAWINANSTKLKALVEEDLR